ncbi:dihydrofolate synthase/folylpolyglutamate synthase [Natronospira proteinivora]|uniref:Dihydrofolate synthase/folylpolyglutamate synthase n=1 Tax=Natronospira proteinivora TaxID=1807133 RepID=A0ABT1G9X4_9GAMM|nr:dihydrofolate synthase/folylpolyglutamate synthase [Natronospira proteinivora]
MNAGSGHSRAPAATASLNDWLVWLEGLHPVEVDLGLDRLRPVCGAMGLDKLSYGVLTVAGTNGKGSSVAVAEGLLRADGCRVGAYTSPHLIDFNERIRVDGQPATDRAIIASLARVDEARGGASLSYFEFTTLAALDLFRRQGVDYAVLEVGLGGRLDAVNVVDADVALLTRVAVDHADWLGDDLDGIAREKAGICRPGRPAVIADPSPEGPLPAAARAHSVELLCAGEAFGWRDGPGSDWTWWGPEEQTLSALPSQPWWQLPWQRDNASGALAAVAQLRPQALDSHKVRRVLADIQLPGRVQLLGGAPDTLLDVAHNPDAATALASWLEKHPVSGKRRAVLGMKGDKDVAGVLGALEAVVDEWWLADLSEIGGLSLEQLKRHCPELVLARLAPLNPDEASPGPLEAWQAALAASRPEDQVLVMGSFMTVGPVLREWRQTRHTETHKPSANPGSR